MKNKKSPEQLAKFLAYVLGRRPDEFGLIPDEEGWVGIMELIQALNEEEGWRHVRRASINEVAVTVAPSPVEMEEKRIRAVVRNHLPPRTVADPAEKLLYTGITAKSYPTVSEKGIFPTRHPYILLTTDKPLAERIARRRDPSPVVLTVNVEQAAATGSVFYRAAEAIYLTDHIAPGGFSGPPLPKTKPDATRKAPPPKPEAPKTPGSYTITLEKDPAVRKESPGSWKRDKKRIRRQKQKSWPS